MLSKCSRSYTIQRIKAFPNCLPVPSSSCLFLPTTFRLALVVRLYLPLLTHMFNAFTSLSQWLIRRLFLLAVEWLTWLRSNNWMNEMLLKYCSSSARPLAQALTLNSHNMCCISAFSSLYCCHSTVNFSQNWCWLLWSVCIDLTVSTRSYRR